MWRCPQNIDPFEQYTDAQVWDALEKAQMKEALEKLPEKLDTAVGEGGDAVHGIGVLRERLHRHEDHRRPAPTPAAWCHHSR